MTNFKIEAATGIYYETSRISGLGHRMHVTAGLEVNPYFINLGTGFDLTSGFQNYIFTVGIDIVRTARSFDIIPPDPVKPFGGSFPNITQVSPEGLPGGLTGDEPRKDEPLKVEDVKAIVKEVPANISKKVAGEPTSVEVKEAKKKPRKRKKR